MERTESKRVALMALLAVVCALLLACAFAPQPAHAASAKMYSLEVNKTYTKYDVTGDGKPDKLKVKHDESHIIGGKDKPVKVYVNGKKRAVSAWECDGCLIVRLVRLSNGVPLLYINESTANAYYSGGWVYRYRAGKFRCLLKTDKLVNAWCKHPHGTWRPYEALVKAKGTTLTFKVGASGSGDASLDRTYKYKYKGGKLVRVKVTE